jgi:acetyl-CoA acetyltransferase
MKTRKLQRNGCLPSKQENLSSICERYGLATLCIGGGEAVAAIFEKV